ncbi:hypothetical protein NECAME_06877 [Necator americanus]|uniref:Uncharacterized protein n=1 Tax=Necator americanus TaxID=51031 RepID=W2TS23_NECAM|nr:hypothetical protein NECAME_06877 [Necator americanus]ETN84474.1 hypothetical protein NECAME_06877 [Necator americanus]
MFSYVTTLIRLTTLSVLWHISTVYKGRLMKMSGF